MPLALLALFLAAPAAAHYYQAEPAAAPQTARVIAGELAWQCAAGGCVAGRSGSRPLIDCEGLVRAVGQVRRFTAGGTPISPEQLEKCNARAR